MKNKGMDTFFWTIKNLVYRILRPILRVLGFDIFIFRRRHHYTPDYFGRSAHKQNDIRTLSVFGQTAEKVVHDGRVSLYYDRLFTIYQILINWKIRTQKNDQVIRTAEVGVYKGGTSFFIASIAAQLGLRLDHACFDTFEGHAVEDINPTVETSHTPNTFSDTSVEAVREYLKEFENVSIFKGRFQFTNTPIEEKKMHFVHLDMDIYEPTVYALNFFRTRMVRGGVILLDDYGFQTCPGIERAVHEFLSSTTAYFGCSLLSGQFILVKL